MNHPDNLLLKTASWLLLILGVASTVRCIMELLEGAVTLIFLLSLCTALLSLLAGWVGLKACFHQNMAQLALYTGILLTFDQILYLVLLFSAGSREMLGMLAQLLLPLLYVFGAVRWKKSDGNTEK